MFHWLVVDLPLWGVWVRQLGWWNSQYMGKQNSCSKPPSSSKRSTGLRYPLVICYSLLSLLLNMAIEIVDLPSYNMVIFHSYVNVYQRVDFSQPVRQVIEELWTLVQVQPRSQRTALKGPDRASPHRRCLWIPTPRAGCFQSLRRSQTPRRYGAAQPKDCPVNERRRFPTYGERLGHHKTSTRRLKPWRPLMLSNLWT